MSNGAPGNAASGEAIGTDSPVRLKKWQTRRMYNPGRRIVAKRTAEEAGPSCTIRDRKDGNTGRRFAIKKKLEKFSTIFARSIRVPDLEYLSRYSDPGDRWFFGLEDSRFPPGFLVKTGQLCIFVGVGCRGNLNRASGQAALWIDKSRFCPVFVPSVFRKAEQIAASNWFTLGSRQSQNSAKRNHQKGLLSR